MVALDLPASHMMVKAEDGRLLNSMMLDMLAAIACDYEDRRRRGTQASLEPGSATSSNPGIAAHNLLRPTMRSVKPSLSATLHIDYKK